MSTVFLLLVAIALVISFTREFKKRGEDNTTVTVWKFLSYYTTLTNILVLLWFAVISFFPNCPVGKFATNSHVAAATTFYIITVGIANYGIYGWQKLSIFERIADIGVHAFTPLITFLFWLFYADKQNLQYELVAYWLIFPLSYAIYTIIHGRWSNFYPYDFTNVQKLGLKRVLLNTGLLTICVFVSSLLFVLIVRTI